MATLDEDSAEAAPSGRSIDPGAETVVTGDGTRPGVDVTLVGPGRKKSTHQVDRGALVGRYVVLDHLGSGGMGVVYAAYDPELDRKIALKLLSTDRAADSKGTGGAARLLREAQAMARLTHPNVIAVHDVGAIGDRVFVAMEFVDGETLRSWVERGGHGWREIVAVFVQAARGLAAAHAVDVVHRDFKPENVMIDGTSRVKVLDFGLARRAHLTESGEVEAAVSLGNVSLDVPLTATGAVMGTPAYMSPEQHRGRSTDGRTDQFSLCAALYEALYGQRPFEGKTLHELASEVLRGNVRPPPRRGPAWLRRVVLRGLSRNPDDRYPNMEALIRALEHDPGRRRRVGVGILGVGLVVGGAWAARASMPSAKLCEGSEALLAGTWGDDQRRAVEATLHERLGTDADAMIERVEDALDGWSRRWVELRTEACVATRIRGDESEEVFVRKTACLDIDRQALETEVEVLRTADRVTALRAAQLAQSLPDLDACADTELLLRGVRPPDDAEVRRRVEDVRGRRIQARTLLAAGRTPEGDSSPAVLVEEAHEIGWRPLLAEVLELQGTEYASTGRAGEGRKVLEEGLLVAEATGHDEMIAEILTDLVAAVAMERRDPDEAHAYGARGLAVIERLGDPPLLRARMLGHIGYAWKLQGEYEPAARDLAEALEISERAEVSPDVTLFDRNNLAGVLVNLGRYSEAEVLLDQALQIITERFGSEHPRMAETLAARGSLRMWQGRDEEALADLRRASDLFASIYGETHPNVAAMLNNESMVLEELGRYDEARSTYLRALSLMQKGPEPDNPAMAKILSNIADVDRKLGDPHDALARDQKALAIRKEWLAADDPLLAGSLEGLGADERQLGDLDGAAEHLLAAISIYEGKKGSRDSSLVGPLRELAEVRIAQGDRGAAESLLRRAWALEVSRPVPDIEGLAKVVFDLARVVEPHAARSGRAREGQPAPTGQRPAPVGHAADHGSGN